MNSWKGMLKKEYHLSKGLIFVGLLALISVSIITYLVSLNKDDYFIGFTFAVLLVIAHSFYLVVYMAVSLNVEAKQLHLWLHNPQSVSLLLLAKVINGLFALIVSLMVSSIYLLISAAQTIDIYSIFSSNYNLISFAVFTALNIIGLSIYNAMWLILFWTVYQILKSRIGKLSWLIIILLLNIPVWIIDILINTKTMSAILNWGVIKVNNLHISANPENIKLEGFNTITLGYYAFYLIVLLLLFFLSSRLIDKKVEV